MADGRHKHTTREGRRKNEGNPGVYGGPKDELNAHKAAKLLSMRQQAHQSLVGFARYIDIPGIPMDATEDRFEIVETPLADHHLLILDTLDKLVHGRLVHRGKTIRRVMFMFPPGAAKSTYASVVFPPWYMGHNPHSEVILTGYGDVIVNRHGRRARQLCLSPAFQSVFGCTLNPAMKAVNDWALTNGAAYKGGGILSGITGFRCDGLVWDDIMKGRKESDSFTIRNDTFNAYVDDARSRKKPEAWEVAIGTRWHEDEPMGRILPLGYNGESGFIECRDGNTWYVLCCPAQCERDDDPLGRSPGEYIWPEWFGEDFWDDKKINPRSWASLYQQRPAPDEGLYFKKEWFRRYDRLPDGNYYISFDPAVSEEEDADDTAMHVWCVDEHAQIHLVNEWVRKCTMDIWIDQLLNWITIYKPMACISEGGVIRRAAEPFLKRAMQKRRIFSVFEWITRSADKSAMARSAQAMYAAGQILHPEGEVGDAMEDELLRFPAAKSDHRVDSVANLCLHLEKVWEANIYERPPEERPTFEGGEMKVSDFMPPRFTKRKSRWAA